jgi:hypothetical protein
MNQRLRLDREDLESRFVFDLDKGEIRFRHTRKGSIAGKLAGTKLADGWHGRIMKNYKVHRIRPSPIKAVADWRLRLLRSEIHGEFAVAC